MNDRHWGASGHSSNQHTRKPTGAGASPLPAGGISFLLPDQRSARLNRVRPAAIGAGMNLMAILSSQQGRNFAAVLGRAVGSKVG